MEHPVYGHNILKNVPHVTAHNPTITLRKWHEFSRLDSVFGAKFREESSSNGQTTLNPLNATIHVIFVE